MPSTDESTDKVTRGKQNKVPTNLVVNQNKVEDEILEFLWSTTQRYIRNVLSRKDSYKAKLALSMSSKFLDRKNVISEQELEANAKWIVDKVTGHFGAQSFKDNDGNRLPTPCLKIATIQAKCVKHLNNFVTMIKSPKVLGKSDPKFNDLSDKDITKLVQTMVDLNFVTPSFLLKRRFVSSRKHLRLLGFSIDEIKTTPKDLFPKKSSRRSSQRSSQSESEDPEGKSYNSEDEQYVSDSDVNTGADNEDANSDGNDVYSSTEDDEDYSDDDEESYAPEPPSSKKAKTTPKSSSKKSKTTPKGSSKKSKTTPKSCSNKSKTTPKGSSNKSKTTSMSSSTSKTMTTPTRANSRKIRKASINAKYRASTTTEDEFVDNLMA